MDSWTLQDAKARFSELVRKAKSSGPQQVTIRGNPEIVVLTLKDYEAMAAQRPSLLSLMKSSPLAGLGLYAQRSGKGREFDL